MSNIDLSELGKQIGERVESFIHSQEVEDLKKNVKSSFTSTMETVQKSINEAVSNGSKKEVKKKELPVQKNPSGKTAGILMTVFGTIGSVLFGALSLVGIIGYYVVGRPIAAVGTGIFAMLMLGTITVAVSGGKMNARISRFQDYVKSLGDKAYCDIKSLAVRVGKKEKFVRKDIKEMINRGWFLEGHMDEKGTCFMATEETYQQYLEAEESLKRREAEEKQKELERRKTEQELKNHPKANEIRSVVEEGQEYIAQIKSANDALPEEEISKKLDTLELVSTKIFDYIQKKPEKLPEIRKFMNYYMPTTLKLVNTYQEFALQPVQGENIKKGKQEIEDILDKINLAFATLFDQLFEDDMLDISTDISVLSTMLEGDGLVGNYFSKEES